MAAVGLAINGWDRVTRKLGTHDNVWPYQIPLGERPVRPQCDSAVAGEKNPKNFSFHLHEIRQ